MKINFEVCDNENLKLGRTQFRTTFEVCDNELRFLKSQWRLNLEQSNNLLKKCQQHMK